MKILMVITYYDPHVSGLTIYCKRISEELARRGHKVTVMASSNLPGLPAREVINGVDVVRLPVALRVSKGVIMPTFPLDAWRLLREHDAVHMHLPLMESSYLAWLARRLRKRSLITYHCDLRLPHSPVASNIVRALTWSHRLAAKQTGYVVTYTRDYAVNSRFLKSLSEKVRTVYPPIDVVPPDRAATRAWKKDLGLDGDRIVGFAGRFSEEKGGNYLLGSIPEVSREIPNVRYLFAGEYKKVIGEDYYGKIQPLIEQYRDRVVFLGELKGQKLSNFYSMSDVLTLPSINSTESFGMVQVEAMLCGTPVVASEIPGVREATKVTGMGKTVPPRDSGALADALKEVILNRDRYTTPRVDIAQTFSVGRNVDFYEGLYAE